MLNKRLIGSASALLLALAGCAGAGEAPTDQSPVNSQAADEQTMTTAVDGVSTDQNAAVDVPQLRAQLQAEIVAAVGEEMASRVTDRSRDASAPIYALTLDNGNVVEWYEFIDGLVMISEEVQADNLPVTDRNGLNEIGSPVELFLELAPDSAVPAELEALSARIVEMQPIYAKLEAVAERFAPFSAVLTENPADLELPEEVAELTEQSFELPAGVEQMGAALTGSQCLAKFTACFDDSIVDYAYSEKDRTSDTYLRRNGTHVTKVATCISKGTVTLEIKILYLFSWSTPTKIDLTAPTERASSFLSNNFGYDIKLMMHTFRDSGKGTHCMNGRN